MALSSEDEALFDFGDKSKPSLTQKIKSSIGGAAKKAKDKGKGYWDKRRDKKAQEAATDASEAQTDAAGKDSKLKLPDVFKLEGEGKGSTMKWVAIIVVAVLIFGFFTFTDRGRDLTTDISSSFEDWKITDTEAWIAIDCTFNPYTCGRNEPDPSVIPETESGVELETLEAETEYFVDNQPIILRGVLEYTPWESEWAINPPNPRTVAVGVSAKDPTLVGEWTCIQPESLAFPEFRCTHPGIVGNEELKENGQVPVNVIVTYNFTTVGDRKLFVMQRNQYYPKKGGWLDDAGYKEEETIRTVGAPAEITVGSNYDWDEVITIESPELAATDKRTISIKLTNMRDGKVILTAIADGSESYISVKIPAFLVDNLGLIVDCMLGKEIRSGEFIVCTKTFSSIKIIENKGDSETYNIGLTVPNTFVSTGIQEIDLEASAEYDYRIEETERVNYRE